MESPVQLSSDELAMLNRGEPLRLCVDSQELVIVLAGQYERLKQAVDGADADPKAIYPLIANVLPEDWEELSSYPNAERL
jgi:hypothetical protein